MIKLPEDVIQYILEFNPDHRAKFKLTFNDLESKAAVMKYNIITNEWNRFRDEEKPSFYQFIIMSNHIDDFQRYVKALYKCNCCERHQINKPTHFYDMEWDVEIGAGFDHTMGALSYATRSECIKKCSCPCRHMARQCCVASLPAPEPQVLDYWTD
tara:strand:- start:3182 stop:3649 length:468 start_codon:yes stop_codon:yes gene_type:complete